MSEALNLEELHNYYASMKAPIRDMRRYQNDPTVHTMATHLARGMEEMGIENVTAAFRVAIEIYNYRRFEMAIDLKEGER